MSKYMYTVENGVCIGAADPCENVICNDGFCTAVANEEFGADYTCECGADAAGQHCEHVLPCSEAPCLNNGTCTDTYKNK